MNKPGDIGIVRRRWNLGGSNRESIDERVWEKCEEGRQWEKGVTPRSIPESSHLHTRRRENLKSHRIQCLKYRQKVQFLKHVSHANVNMLQNYNNTAYKTND
jgi:hypothetical protein